MRRLEGKVAIVTGGGGGIGSAVARRIVQEGGRVAISDRWSMFRFGSSSSTQTGGAWQGGDFRSLVDFQVLFIQQHVASTNMVRY